MEQSIIQLDFADEMKNSYRDYAVSVIISRALPDVRDGLKPVQSLGFPLKNHTEKAPVLSGIPWVNTIHMATAPFTMRWFI